MNILFIAPQPFFVNRGTPLAIRNMCRVLGKNGHSIDLLTSHIGGDVSLPNTRLVRIKKLPFSSMKAGFSGEKILLDVAIALKMLSLVRTQHYDVIHCVEEAAFIASTLKFWLGCPFVCDVDSSIPHQMREKGGFGSVLAPAAGVFEKNAIKNCICAVTVCPALTDHVRTLAPDTPVFQIEDPPMIDEHRFTEAELGAVRRKLDIEGRKIVLYMGNFEPYQGVELLMRSFAAAAAPVDEAILLIIGGSEKDVASKRRLAERLGIAGRTRFTGLLPPEETAIYLQAADVLVSPRLKGENTPMKIYTYMASGTAILATDLYTHTQVLDSESAYLASPKESAIGKGLEKLIENDTLRNRLAEKAQQLVREKYSFAAYSKKVKDLYIWIAERLENRKRTVG